MCAFCDDYHLGLGFPGSLSNSCQDYLCRLFKINLSDLQLILTMTIICDCWWHLKILVLECYQLMLGRPGWFKTWPDMGGGYLGTYPWCSKLATLRSYGLGWWESWVKSPAPQQRPCQDQSLSCGMTKYITGRTGLSGTIVITGRGTTHTVYFQHKDKNDNYRLLLHYYIGTHRILAVYL